MPAGTIDIPDCTVVSVPVWETTGFLPAVVVLGLLVLVAFTIIVVNWQESRKAVKIAKVTGGVDASK